MKIRDWLGYNEDSSQYLLKPGELRALVNLQPRRPGMLIARSGLIKIYGKYDDEAIFQIHRRDKLLTEPSDFVWLQKARVPRVLTVEQLLAQEDPLETVWIVRRVEGTQSRVIAQLPVSPDGTASIAGMSIAEDRHGRMFLFFGCGQQPLVYRPDDLANVCLPLGLAAPKASPVVTGEGRGYFLEAVDVTTGGGSYYAPPTITVLGGNPERNARLRGIVSQGNVVGIDVIDGGANYQTFPRIEVATDKVGSGFRAIGNFGAAPPIAGFVESTPGAIAGTAPSQTETYGTTNGVVGNSIMYLASPVTANTRVASHSGTSMTVESVAGIRVGDLVRVSPAQGAPFDDTNTTVTVTAIDSTSRVVTISESWTPANATPLYYAVQFRSASEIAYAEATYNTTTKRFTASFPLTTVSGSGAGAEATLSFTPVSYSFGIGAFQSDSYTVPANGATPALFAYKRIGVDNYLYDDYWSGSKTDKPNSKENTTYAGLQASGSGFVFGFSGTIGGRRADAYWPDYSKLSVWTCVGSPGGAIQNWTRADVPVFTDAGTYILVQLRPTASGRVAVPTGKTSFTTGTSAFDKTPTVIYPTVKIFLKQCPDSWISYLNVGGDYSLPTEVKEGQKNRLSWWNQQSGVPRPIVDFQGSSSAIDWDTCEVVDPGAGWAYGTTFAIRIYQANAYEQKYDYNTAIQEPRIGGAHSYFSPSTRYSEFLFTATSPDINTPDGPPHAIDGTANIDVAGSGYANLEKARLTLYKRSLADGVSTAVPSNNITWTAEQIAPAPSGNVITSIRILSTGRNYYAAPTIEVRGGGDGYGLAVQPQITDGRITSVAITDPGKSYTASPELYTNTTAATAVPVMRPTLFGKYRCAYRYADRSETVVGTYPATVGEAGTLLIVASTADIKAGMVVDGDGLPLGTRVLSVSGTQLELSQEITGKTAGQSVTVVIRDMTKPVAYSDLSPIFDVEISDSASRLVWSLPSAEPPERADIVELWRTSADQSLVFYRLDSYGIPSANGVEIIGEDRLTDEELFDPDRANYAAMPVVLPNGNLNAYRFGVPRSDMSVCVAFQDRLWYGVSTSGKDANTLYYSEYDEFESCPDLNDLPIQNNTKSTDSLTALVPFGSMLLAMQHSHTYAVTYNTDPAIDASIQMMSHRGCLHQRCWDIHENILYSADESGIYAMSRSGEVNAISAQIKDFFVSESIDFSRRSRFFLQVDPRTHILRFFCTLSSAPTDTPDFALCYDIERRVWWTERWPNSVTSACSGRPGVARVNSMLLGCVDGNLYKIDEDADHCNQTITDCMVAEGGSGYTRSPKVTCPNSEGVQLRGVVSEGRLVDVLIHSSGWNAKWGIQLLAEDGSSLQDHSGRDIKGVEYAPIRLDIEPPSSGGRQAVAYANFSVTPRVFRYVTVAQGEAFVRLLPKRFAGYEQSVTDLIASESGLILTAESPDATLDGRQLRTEPPPVEIGMECIGNYIPLNAFVSRIDGKDIYLEHPDGTAAAMLFGEPRYNQEGTPADYLELGGTETTVIFRKPYNATVPFRLSTGVMPMANEDTVPKNGDALLDRSVTLVYSPTSGKKEVEIIEYFNSSDTPRPNIMRRSRGGPGGWEHRQDSASTVLNISSSASPLGAATGVAKARFASRQYTDMGGADQHVQVELHGRPRPCNDYDRINFWLKLNDYAVPQPFVMHSLTIDGVITDG